MKNIMQTMQFTEEEIAFFLDLDARLPESARARIEFLRERYLRLKIDDNFAEGEWRTNVKVGETLGYLAEGMGIHPYTMHMLFLIGCAKWLPGEYERRGLDVANAVNMIQDIRYKLRECEKMEGFMGTSTYNWFHRHFLVTRFALGRFQYDPGVWEYENDYVFGDYKITKGGNYRLTRFLPQMLGVLQAGKRHYEHRLRLLAALRRQPQRVSRRLQPHGLHGRLRSDRIPRG